MSNSFQSGPSSAQPAPGVNLTRTFDTTASRIFKAWTDPKHLAQWWAPGSTSNTVRQWDMRPEGALLIETTMPDGKVFPTKGVFREIAEPERLTLVTTAYEDKKGNPLVQIEHRLVLSEANKKTLLNLRVIVIKTAIPIPPAALAAMEANWNASLDRLTEELDRVE